jgi:hypothetical protein
MPDDTSREVADMSTRTQPSINLAPPSAGLGQRTAS